MSVRNLRSKFAILSASLAVAAILGGSAAHATVYMTAGYTPGTAGFPGTPGDPAVAPVAGALIQSFDGGALTDTSSTWRRPTGSTSEIDPAPSATLAGLDGDLYYYSAVTFTPTVSQEVDFYQATAFDGFLHIYGGSFDPNDQFTNLIGGNDDMTTLHGGTVPNNHGLPAVTYPDSGLRFFANAGTTYTAVTSTYDTITGTPLPTNGGQFYSELRVAGTDGSPAGPQIAPPSAGEQGSPATPIVDNDPTQPAVLTLSVGSHGTISAFNRVNLIDAEHTWVGDLVVTLTHGDITVTILNRQGSSSDWLAGLTYQFTDAGATYPTINALGSFDYRSNGLLSAFAGLDVFGDWTLSITDNAGGDTGSICAFSIDVTAGAAAVPGDYNHDGHVDAADYTVWADHFGQTGAGVLGDGNGDGVVDAADYTVWADHFGQGGSLVSAVPEPTLLAAAPLLVPFLRRRR